MTPLNRKFGAGLAALGLVWTSATTAEGQEVAPPPPAPAPVPAPPNAPAFAVLVLSNGRLLQGIVSENAAGDAYELQGKGGSFPVPKKDVRRRYGSMEELYEAKVAALPDRDPDERMKLALWCLEQHMEDQARDQLKGLLAINPSDVRAQRMVASIDANARRAAGRDPEVRAAGAEVVQPARPRAMPMPRARSRATEPVIFDLPPEVARKRFVEFAWYVHPVLQASCASCHNDTYQGEYRLIAGASRRDWTADVVRANLDATLRHVRRDDPTHSDLVAYAANPHGPTPRAIFHGANDPRYQHLMTWLHSIRPAEAAAKPGPAAPSAVASAAPPAEGFGSDRLPRSPGTAAMPAPMPGPPPLPGMAGQTYVESYQMEAVAPGVPPGVTFDMPALPGTARNVPPPAPGGPARPAPRAATAPASTPPVAPQASSLPALPPGTPVPPPDDVIPPTNRSKRAKEVDPALLENLMKARRGGQP